MKNINVINKISQGMYVLTTNGGGCIVDSVSQISSDEKPLISVAVMKKNYTNTLLKSNKKFAISIIGKECDPNLIKTFGFNSGRDIDKFKNTKTEEISGVQVIKDTLGYFVCEIVDFIDNDTHTLFIGRIIEADLYKDTEEMTYNYYKEHKDELLKVTTEKGKTAWVCTICGYVYYGETLPSDFTCPACGVDKNLFKKQ